MKKRRKNHQKTENIKLIQEKTKGKITIIYIKGLFIEIIERKGEFSWSLKKKEEERKREKNVILKVKIIEI